MNLYGLAIGTRRSRAANGYCPDCVPLVQAVREPFEWVQTLGGPARTSIRYRCKQCGVFWEPKTCQRQRGPGR